MDIERLIAYFDNQTNNSNPKKEPGFCSAIIQRGDKNYYANGMVLSPEQATIPYFFHTGGYDGFHTLVIRVPSQKLSMLYLSNNPAVDFDLSTTRSRKLELIS